MHQVFLCYMPAPLGVASWLLGPSFCLFASFWLNADLLWKAVLAFWSLLLWLKFEEAVQQTKVCVQQVWIKRVQPEGDYWHLAACCQLMTHFCL